MNTMFPLPLFPTIPDVLDTMDARLSLQHINTFMKNTLIRAVNNLYDLAPHIHNKEDLEHFLRYATMVCDVLLSHLRGDQLFFNGKNSQGATLVACLGIEDTTAQDFTLLINVTNGLQQNLHVWAKAPESYSHSALRSSLSNVAKVMLPGMANQRRALGTDNLMKYCTEETEMHKMIHENLIWLTGQIDISILLPFVLSHHDLATSAHWPGVSPEGLELISSFVQKDPSCWSLAPFDPITRQQYSQCPLLSAL